MNNNISVFISYQWNSTVIADEFENLFEYNGLNVIRDKKSLKYKASLKEFMQSIREQDFVLMIISEEYLKSLNCMREVIELSKEKDFKKKIIQVVLNNTNIYNAKGRFSIHNYWNKEYEELKQLATKTDPTRLSSIAEELKLMNDICNNILSFTAFLADEINIPIERLRETNFSDIANYIRFPLKQPNSHVNILKKERPKELPADLYRFEFNRTKYLFFVTTLNEKPFEIIIGIIDNDSLHIPIKIKTGVVIKEKLNDGNYRMDFKYVDKHGYKATFEGITSHKYDSELQLVTQIVTNLLIEGFDYQRVISSLDNIEAYSQSSLKWKELISNILLNYVGDDIAMDNSQENTIHC